jgi:enamine deaminase RidA (YjgF/YER057c/UK114 family)
MALAVYNYPDFHGRTRSMLSFKVMRHHWIKLIHIALSIVTLVFVNDVAADVVRYPLPYGNKFPIASAVEVTEGTTLIFVSGRVASPNDPNAQPGTAAYWGDTRTQAVSAFDNIKKGLEIEGVGFGDVVKMLVFLVGDPANDNKMDFAGFMDVYRQYFGTPDQPNLPARSVVQVPALAAPGALIEIEAIVAMPNKAPATDSGPLSIEASKKECLELGFRPKSDALGACVLQLSK